MAQQKTDFGQYIKYAFWAAGAYLGFVAIKKIGETFGLIQTKAEANVEQASAATAADTTQAASETANPAAALNPNWGEALIKAFKAKYPKKVWDNVKQSKLTAAQFYKLAQQLDWAKGTFNDDEDSVYNVFRQLQTQYQVSQLARFFNALSKKDLLEYLKSFMNSDEIDKVLTIISKYPQYFK